MPQSIIILTYLALQTQMSPRRQEPLRQNVLFRLLKSSLSLGSLRNSIIEEKLRYFQEKPKSLVKQH